MDGPRAVRSTDDLAKDIAGTAHKSAVDYFSLASQIFGRDQEFLRLSSFLKAIRRGRCYGNPHADIFRESRTV